MTRHKSLVVLIETLNRGGIETVLLRLLPQLKRAGWASTIVTIEGGGEMLPDYRAAQIPVIPLNRRYLLSPRTLSAIGRQIKELSPDLVVTTLFKADMIGRLFLKLALRQPVVPYLVTTYNHPRYWIARVWERLTKDLVSFYIANSPAVKEFYEKTLNVTPGKIDVLPNGVDISIFQKASGQKVNSEFDLPAGAFVVTCVANLAPNKGQLDLLEAFEEAFADEPSAYLLLVGEGELRDVLTARRRSLRSKNRIHLLGRRIDVPSILKATTIFALPTLFEGMSTALLEAMAAGKAIVTTDIPENKVLLAHERSALLFKPQNRHQLARALLQMFADPSLRERLAAGAFQRVSQHYSIESMARKAATIFDRLCGFSVQEKLRVVHVINSLESGGAENMLLRTLPLLNKDEFEQVVVTLFQPGELAPQFHRKDVTTVNIGLKNIANIRFWPKITEQISQFQPNLIITYLFHAHLIGRLYLRGRFAAPVIPFLRTTYNFPRYLTARLVEKMTKGLVSHYLANSTAVKEYYIHNIGVKAGKITVIPNGIDVSVFERARGTRVIRELKLPDDRFVISCVANLAVNKGHRYLLEAFEQLFPTHPNLWLLLVGEGSEEANLRRMIEDFASRNHILFLGRRHDVPEILAASDAFVLPTLFEGMSNAILEAMAAGLAIVTTDIPENRAIITQNVSGRLVEPGNSRAIQEALYQVVVDNHLRNRLGFKARIEIRERFSLSKVTDQWKRVLRKWARRD